MFQVQIRVKQVKPCFTKYQMQVQLIFKAQFKNQLYLVDRRLIVENRGLKPGVGWKIQ